jgi:phage terminase large subunit
MRIKLPNNWRPRGYQLPVWNYLENGGKHAELVWHRRSGKDEVGLHRTACSAFERVAGYWYMLPEYSQARKAIWDAINPHTGKKRIDEAFPLELRKATRNQEMMIEFKNNSSFQVVGSDNPNSLVGSAPAGIVYSEWALSNPASRAYLRPILAENNGWQIFNTTSRGRNHAYKTLQAAKNDPLAFAQVLTARQTDVFTEEQLEAELQSYINDFGEEYGTSKFEQEYLCSFDAANLGAILARSIGKLEQAGRVGPHVEYDTLGAGIEISADIGRRDAATWYFWQPKIGGYSIIDYDGGWGLDAEQWADRLAEKISNGGYKLTKIWLPHDARAKTFAAKHSAVEIFIKKFGADKIAITPDSKKSDRVNAARTIIKHCEFSDKCEQGSEPKHDWASHDGDGFSYGCLIMQMTKPPIKIDETLRAISVGESGVINVSLDELWSDKQQSRRY